MVAKRRLRLVYEYVASQSVAKRLVLSEQSRREHKIMLRGPIIQSYRNRVGCCVVSSLSADLGVPRTLYHFWQNGTRPRGTP